MIKLFLLVLSLVSSAVFAAEASPSFASLDSAALESSKGHGHRSHHHRHHPHQHHRSSSSSSSSSHHHRHHHLPSHHHCSEQALIKTAVDYTKVLQNYIVTDNPSAVLDLALPTATVLNIGPSCVLPLAGCCKTTVSLTDFLGELLNLNSQFINQIPECNVKVLPCGSIVVTSVLVLTNLDPLFWQVKQVEITWKKTYGCNMKFSAIKVVDSACVGKIVNTLCSDCQ